MLVRAKSVYTEDVESRVYTVFALYWLMTVTDVGNPTREYRFLGATISLTRKKSIGQYFWRCPYDGSIFVKFSSKVHETMKIL